MWVQWYVICNEYTGNLSDVSSTAPSVSETAGTCAIRCYEYNGGGYNGDTENDYIYLGWRVGWWGYFANIGLGPLLLLSKRTTTSNVYMRYHSECKDFKNYFHCRRYFGIHWSLRNWSFLFQWTSHQQVDQTSELATSIARRVGVMDMAWQTHRHWRQSHHHYSWPMVHPHHLCHHFSHPMYLVPYLALLQFGIPLWQYHPG